MPERSFLSVSLSHVKQKEAFLLEKQPGCYAKYESCKSSIEIEYRYVFTIDICHKLSIFSGVKKLVGIQ